MPPVIIDVTPKHDPLILGAAEQLDIAYRCDAAAPLSFTVSDGFQVSSPTDSLPPTGDAIKTSPVTVTVTRSAGSTAEACIIQCKLDDDQPFPCVVGVQ